MKSNVSDKLNRRQFIGQCAHTVGSMSIVGLLLGTYARRFRVHAGAGHPPAGGDRRGGFHRRLRALRPVRAGLPLRYPETG